MALFLAKRYNSVPQYFFADAEARLVNIVSMDVGIGFDEQNTVLIEGVECIRVTYTPTLSGPTNDRINALVNNLSGYTAPPDIVIFAVNNSMIDPTGSVVPFGLSLAPGAPSNPLLYNVCCIYNAGACPGQDAVENKYTGGTTPVAAQHLLYYELAHCFKYVTQGDITDDVQASTDENDLRTAQGQDNCDMLTRGIRCIASTGSGSGGSSGSGGTGGCFPGWTRILTPSGWMRIYDLGAGDLVVSFDPATGGTFARPVTRRIDHQPAKLWEIATNRSRQVIATTERHPFLTRHGWVLTNQLRAGDELVTLEGYDRLVSVCKSEKFEIVHNIHTSGEHTFILEGGFVVHNFAYFRALRTLWHRAFRDQITESSTRRQLGLDSTQESLAQMES